MYAGIIVHKRVCSIMPVCLNAFAASSRPFLAVQRVKESNFRQVFWIMFTGLSSAVIMSARDERRHFIERICSITTDIDRAFRQASFESLEARTVKQILLSVRIVATFPNYDDNDGEARTFATTKSTTFYTSQNGVNYCRRTISSAIRCNLIL
ncbi:uncharacterized protein LOC134185701 [Corticium candelabrum]|uniref:uncharacterized protein LOC134185701 n=1 Tax=Corticium candelabrum TaxID=121492 RepID=UPI002E26C4F5|nr:uncharacterized protein LOC134185701 [Corticium candelabrum]